MIVIIPAAKLRSIVSPHFHTTERWVVCRTTHTGRMLIMGLGHYFLTLGRSRRGRAAGHARQAVPGTTHPQTGVR